MQCPAVSRRSRVIAVAVQKVPYELKIVTTELPTPPLAGGAPPTIAVPGTAAARLRITDAMADSAMAGRKRGGHLIGDLSRAFARNAGSSSFRVGRCLGTAVQAGFTAGALGGAMSSALRFAIGSLFLLGLLPVLVPARGDDGVRAVHVEDTGRPAASGGSAHACLDQRERHAEAGKFIPLAAAMRAVRTRMPGTVVRARLCH